MEIDKIVIKERGDAAEDVTSVQQCLQAILERSGFVLPSKPTDRNVLPSLTEKKPGTDRDPVTSLLAPIIWRSYVGRKLKYKPTRAPLVWSEQTRRAVQAARISTSSQGASVRYSGARVLNFHPDLAKEFRRIIPAKPDNSAAFTIAASIAASNDTNEEAKAV
ncbi:MAG: hypothetical protein U0905_13690 [Pirellulales bacterium]